MLLLVYLLYLLFSLKSHAFMYQSTPQHIIDEESHPGVLAEILNSSSSSGGSSSSSSSDTDSSSNSKTTTKRIKRAFRRRRRKSTSSTKDNASLPTFTRSSSALASHGDSMIAGPTPAELEPVFSGDEADLDGEEKSGRHRSRTHTIRSRDFENGVSNDQGSQRSKKRHKKSEKAQHIKKDKGSEKGKNYGKEKETLGEIITKEKSLSTADTLQPQVGFVQEIPHDGTTKRPFNIRNLSEAVKPAFSSANFPHHEATGRPLAIPIRPTSQPRSSPHQVRRTTSMPDILRPTVSNTRLSPPVPAPPQHDASTLQASTEVQTDEVVEPQTHLSKTSAVVLLLCTTGLVALCAEFLVGSIDYLIANSGVSQAFIGLIILPIIGNAAEHVTAVTVAAKNKMDLAINIALGSSIQIALFVTPLMVILGWIIKTNMSLYFSLFETVSLFASAFIVSFLMIDGRSNYLEGALLIAAYVIIAVAAFFYPTCDLSSASGPMDGVNPIC